MMDSLKNAWASIAGKLIIAVEQFRLPAPGEVFVTVPIVAKSFLKFDTLGNIQFVEDPADATTVNYTSAVMLAKAAGKIISSPQYKISIVPQSEAKVFSQINESSFSGTLITDHSAKATKDELEKMIMGKYGVHGIGTRYTKGGVMLPYIEVAVLDARSREFVTEFLDTSMQNEFYAGKYKDIPVHIVIREMAKAQHGNSNFDADLPVNPNEPTVQKERIFAYGDYLGGNRLSNRNSNFDAQIPSDSKNPTIQRERIFANGTYLSSFDGSHAPMRSLATSVGQVNFPDGSYHGKWNGKIVDMEMEGQIISFAVDRSSAHNQSVHIVISDQKAYIK